MKIKAMQTLDYQSMRRGAKTATGAFVLRVRPENGHDTSSPARDTRVGQAAANEDAWGMITLVSRKESRRTGSIAWDTSAST